MFNRSLVDVFYQIKPFVPRKLQLYFRRKLVINRLKYCADRWPIDPNASTPPSNWKGWPENKKFALVLTHDVDTQKGYNNCEALVKLEQEMGFRSSFNFVPERDYSLTPEFRQQLESEGFEVAVHDLKHDGKLFRSEKTFKDGAKRINSYLEKWGCSGFRAGAMHCNLDWIHHLNIDYDASTFDTDPFEPKPESRPLIFPSWVEPNPRGNGFVELPYTLPQDFTLYVMMREKNITIWRKKVDWLVEHGGMVLLITHPDYMNFSGKNLTREEYPAQFYRELLEYIASKYAEQYWHALPRDIARFVKSNIL